jgi:hypothetical protein
MAEMGLLAVLPSMILVHVDSTSTPRGVTHPYPVITGLDEFTEGMECSPKVDPSVMRVCGAEAPLTSNETKKT